MQGLRWLSCSPALPRSCKALYVILSRSTLKNSWTVPKLGKHWVSILLLAIIWGVLTKSGCVFLKPSINSIQVNGILLGCLSEVSRSSFTLEHTTGSAIGYAGMRLKNALQTHRMTVYFRWVTKSGLWHSIGLGVLHLMQRRIEIG